MHFHFHCYHYQGGGFLCKQEKIQDKEIPSRVVSESSPESHRVKTRFNGLDVTMLIPPLLNLTASLLVPEEIVT